tara:strand:+ start:3274 stop:3654 length:381 start_codon:yes stop_codon:yes gene_type:complete
MLSFREVNVLGNICDTTVGKSSTVRSPTISIKTSLQDDKFSVTYITIVNLASVYEMRDLAKRYEEESIKIINEYMKNVKRDFRSEAGRSLKVKELNSSDTMDVITASAFSPRRNAYYKRTTTFRIE